MKKIRFILFFLFVANTSLKAQSDSSTFGTIKIAKTDSATYYFNLGKQLYNEEKYDSAITCLSKCLTFNSLHSKAYNGRCACYIRKNNYDSAFKDCLTSVGLDSLQTEAFFNLGLCYSYIQKYANAITYFSISLKNYNGENDLDIGSTFYERARAYEETKDAIKAKKDMEEAAKYKDYRAIQWLSNKTSSSK